MEMEIEIIFFTEMESKNEREAGIIFKMEISL